MLEGLNINNKKTKMNHRPTDFELSSADLMYLIQNYATNNKRKQSLRKVIKKADSKESVNSHQTIESPVIRLSHAKR